MKMRPVYRARDEGARRCLILVLVRAPLVEAWSESTAGVSAASVGREADVSVFDAAVFAVGVL